MAIDLSLPEAPRPRSRAGLVQWLTLAAAVAILVLLALEARGKAPEAAPAGDRAREAERLKSLATDLEKRTLYVQAEQVWGEYMAAAALTPEEEAATLYRRGKCLKEGGRPAEAARRLSEVEGFPIPREEKRKSRQLLVECLSALGKQDVRDSVMRSFAIGEEEKGTVVARVGSDAITREEVRSDLVSDMEHVLRLQGAPLTPAELAQKAAELADARLQDPETMKGAVLQAVSSRVLYREGLERGFADDEATAQAVMRFRTQSIANRVIETEVEAAMKGLGATELQNHFEANRERFVEKPGVEFSLARFPGPAEAEAAIEKLKDPAKASQVKLTRVKEAAVAGEPVPEIGPSAEVAAHILALGEGEVSSRPILHGETYHVFRAEKKRGERQLTFAEAETRVRADLAAVKRKEALEALQKLLSQKFQVEIADEKAPAAAPADSKGERKDGKDGAGDPRAAAPAPPDPAKKP